MVELQSLPEGVCMSPLFNRRIIAAVLATSVFLAACGGSDSSSSRSRNVALEGKTQCLSDTDTQIAADGVVTLAFCADARTYKIIDAAELGVGQEATLLESAPVLTFDPATMKTTFDAKTYGKTVHVYAYDNFDKLIGHDVVTTEFLDGCDEALCTTASIRVAGSIETPDIKASSNKLVNGSFSADGLGWNGVDGGARCSGGSPTMGFEGPDGLVFSYTNKTVTQTITIAQPSNVQFIYQVQNRPEEYIHGKYLVELSDSDENISSGIQTSVISRTEFRMEVTTTSPDEQVIVSISGNDGGRNWAECYGPKFTNASLLLTPVQVAESSSTIPESSSTVVESSPSTPESSSTVVESSSTLPESSPTVVDSSPSTLPKLTSIVRSQEVKFDSPTLETPMVILAGVESLFFDTATQAAILSSVNKPVKSMTVRIDNGAPIELGVGLEATLDVPADAKVMEFTAVTTDGESVVVTKTIELTESAVAEGSNSSSNTVWFILAAIVLILALAAVQARRKKTKA